MQSAPHSPQNAAAELPGMVATLCSYENWLGPYHHQTLTLMIEIGIAYRQAGELSRACCVLERAIRDLGRHHAPADQARVRGIAMLGEIFRLEGHTEQAASLERELFELTPRPC